jgi:hypothetical protein
MNLYLRKRVAPTTLATAGVLICAVPALGQRSVALVEDVRGSPADVQFMDYVSVGKAIRLGPSQSVVLGYLTSCWREIITGGTVIVGHAQSEVQGGSVTRTKVTCDGGNLALTREQANQSAGTSFRTIREEPPLTLYGLSPVIDATGGAALLIVRTDRGGEYHVTTLPVRQGTQRSFLDLARVRTTLAAGGTYRASIGSRQITFKVDPRAKPRGVPIISRLLRFAETD